MPVFSKDLQVLNLHRNDTRHCFTRSTTEIYEFSRNISISSHWLSKAASGAGGAQVPNWRL
jgi:hypothetical protein